MRPSLRIALLRTVAAPARQTACLLLGLPVAVHAGALPRLEAAFSPAVAIADPFDPVTADVRVAWVSPDGTTNSLPAFFDGGVTWRVRHTPRASGRHFIAGVSRNGTPLPVTGLSPTNWFVSGPATDPGFVRVDAANPLRFVTDDDRRYFPVGHNVCWNPSVSNDFPRIFARMAAAGENWTRVWMDHFYQSKNLDWPKVNNTFGELSLPVARRWDLIVQEAEQAGLALQMVFQHHGQYSSTNGSNVNANWEQNPYNTLNGGFLAHATQFFTNATAKALTQRKLRYAVARWGYSPAIMAWELWNEVQFTDAAYAGQWSNIAAWHSEMAAYLRAQDPYGHLITTSSDLSRPIWGAMDFYQFHNYASDMVTSSRDAEEPPPGSPVKPNFAGEGAQINPPHLWIHAPIWPGAMSTQAGTMQPWWWDTIDPQNSYFVFKSLRDFLDRSGLPEQDGLVKFAPPTTASQNGALSFSPGGGWRAATQTTFVVGHTAPDGIGTAPSFLYGSWHHAGMNMRNGYTFLVNYAQPGTFSVQILEISPYGNSNLRVALDGVTRTNITFLAANGGPTNATFTIAVPAGPHSILLTNGALDWVVLGNLTLDPYVPLLGAYSVGNTNFAAAWVWHRTNLYATTAGAPVTGTVDLTNLRAGSYAAAWWDTYAGAALTNFTLTVPVDGATNRLATPAIQRAAALYVGKPAQAVLTAPPLEFTLGTNSPPLTTTLILSNAGGLPLNYSLSITGNHVLEYSALDSTRPGGPRFAWRDLSATGREVTTNFTALAAPKTAGDEGIAGPFEIGFEFPFFSGRQTPGIATQVWVSPNGFITFAPFAGDRSLNTSLPGLAAPTNLVALVWDDLDLSAGGKVFVASEPEAGRFTVQYEAVRFKGFSSTVTAQATLFSTGEILLQYRALGRTNSCTVGVQGLNGIHGLLLTFNASSYLRSGMAVRLSPADWLRAAPIAGFVPGGKAQAINVSIHAAGLPTRNFDSTLLVRTSDAANPQFALPVSLSVSSQLPAAPGQLAATALTWAQVALTWTDLAGNESGFEIQRRAGEAGAFVAVGTAAANALSFTDTTAPSRTACWYRVRATNSFSASPWSEPACTITPTAPMDLWRQAKFGTMNNTGIAADSADPEGDRVVNFIEYALGLDPNLPDANPFRLTFTGGHLTVTFNRPRTAPADADVRYFAEVTDDLASGVWSTGPALTTTTVTDNLDGTERVTYTDLATPPTPAAHYLRVRFERQ
jgi:hypothetical protein